MENHEIDYKIIGEEMQCVEIELDPNETVIAEAGGLMYMNSNIEMNTILAMALTKIQAFLANF
jgi:uncharacterized protein (AIM24 family)